MPRLDIPQKKTVLTTFDEIKHFLNERGITFEQWNANETIEPDASQEQILRAYTHVLKPFMASQGYQTADVICVDNNTDNLDAIRHKFLQEHIHTEDEVRFFVEGNGYFWFNLEGDEPVFCVTCEAGNLLSVPANTKHWFELADEPDVKAIRMFTDMAGWVPHYTEAKTHEHYQLAVV